MELSGDEKRIQALFSELSLEDQRHTPRFEKLWLRAYANTRVPALVIRRSVVAITAVVVLAVCLLVASSWYRSSQSQHALNIPAQTIPTTSVPTVKEPEKFLSADTKNVRPARRRKVVRQRQTEPEVAALSNWQSPTNIFLNSPIASALSSLPQLNQSARDLETFLPKNEVIKESNQ